MDAAQAAHRWGEAHAEALSRLALPGLRPHQRQQHQQRHPGQPRAARHGCSAALGRAAAPARPRGPAAPARPRGRTAAPPLRPPLPTTPSLAAARGRVGLGVQPEARRLGARLTGGGGAPSVPPRFNK